MSDTIGFYNQFRTCLTEQKHIQIARTPRDLSYSDGLTVIFGLQCLPDDADLSILHHIGVRVISLCYNKPNSFGSGFSDSDGRLTDKGKKTVRECAKFGLIIDLSHNGHNTARDILDLIEKEKLNVAVMASHTGCYEVYNHLRNLPDDVLEWISVLGGVVGIANLTFILDPILDDIGPIMNHVEHAVDVCGAGSVCFGTDGIHRKLDINEWSRVAKKMMADFDGNGSFGARWPDQPLLLNRPDRMQVLETALLEYLAPRVVDRLVGRNLQSFFEASLRRN